mmetsp:Transcript_17602/g.42709  ORF Transcript_17602/g.42709 Transcript_17602/m.42709 type:complete len:613 (-) Transcript_17602:109-1947(-)
MMAAHARPPSRGSGQGLSGRPPSRGLTEGGSRPSSSPRVMLQPLQPPNSQGIVTSQTEDKEYFTGLKKEVRQAAARLLEYAKAVETDHKMADSSSLLRRPLTPGGSQQQSSNAVPGLQYAVQTAQNIDAAIEKASANQAPDCAKTNLLELLFSVLEDAERCCLTLTTKRAPTPGSVPAPSAGQGRMGSRVGVAEALMDRALSLHGAIDRQQKEGVSERAHNNAESASASAGGKGGAEATRMKSLMLRLAKTFRSHAAVAREMANSVRADAAKEGDGGEEDGRDLPSLLAGIEKAAGELQEEVGEEMAKALKELLDGVKGSCEMLVMARSQVLGLRTSGRLVEKGEVKGLKQKLEEAERAKEKLEKEVEVLKKQSEGSESKDAVAKQLAEVAKITALQQEFNALKEENARLKEGLKSSLKLPGASAGPAAAAPTLSRPGTASTQNMDVRDLRNEILSLRGELGVARTQLEKQRQDVISLDSRMRTEKEKADQLVRTVEARDETIAHLRSEVRSMERLSKAGGEAESFEAVLAEEMMTMREAFEQKLQSVKDQMDRESLAFARERKELRDNFDKETKALKRRIEVFQIKTGDYGTPAATPRLGTPRSGTPAPGE